MTSPTPLVAPCSPYGQWCSLGRSSLPDSWLISVWILVGMLQQYLPSGGGKIILASSAAYNYS